MPAAKFDRREVLVARKALGMAAASGCRPEAAAVLLDHRRAAVHHSLGAELRAHSRVGAAAGKRTSGAASRLRYADLDFAGPERDGWEIPWPIRYKDIAPYYDQVDQLIGVCGGDDDQDSLPGSKLLSSASPLRCGEHLIRRRREASESRVVPIRRAVLTQTHNGHTKCHYCGACGNGCDVGAFFNSSDYLIEPAFKTGKLNILRQRGGRANPGG